MTHHLRTRHSGEKKKTKHTPYMGSTPRKAQLSKVYISAQFLKGLPASSSLTHKQPWELQMFCLLATVYCHLCSFMLFALQVVLPQIMSTILFSECISECFLTSKGSCVQMVHCGKEHCCTLMHEDETEIWETHSLLLSYYIYLQHRKSNWHKQRS